MWPRTLLLALLIACRGRTDAMVDGSSVADSAALDGALDGTPDGSAAGIDGTPMRRPCVDAFGTALSDGAFGRLDGILVAIVPPGPNTGPCNADLTHLHLQVLVNDAVYDVAVNVGTDSTTNDVHSAAFDHPLLGPAWSEGWHTGVVVDYPALDVHADSLPLHTRTENVNALMTDLTTANHVSIYATGYGPGGAHLVHRTRGGEDGMVVTQPLSADAHARLFRFSNQVF